MRSCDLIDTEIKTPQNLNLSQLEELDCSLSTISNVSLFALLQKSPNLKNLVLRTHLESEIVPSHDLDLARLEDLSCYLTEITLLNFFALLQKTPNLKKLSLADFYDFDLAIEFPVDLNLSLVKELDFANVCLSTSNLSNFLKKTFNLKKLSWKGNELEFPLDLNLSRFEELNCSGSTLSFAKLFEFLQITPCLKKLNLKHCKNLDGVIELPQGLNLSSLEDLDCCSLDLSMTDLFNLLQKAFNLKKLSLEKCKNLSAVVGLSQSFYLPRLEELNCNYSNTSVSNLLELLKKSPNLKEITLSCNDLRLAIEFPKDLDFLKLEVLDCRNTNISMTNLLGFLQRAPNLKKLFLHSCKNINSSIEFLPDLQLSLLEELDCSASKISMASLFALLQKTPRLKILNLTNCGNLGDTIEPPNDLNLFQLENLECKYSNISMANLFALLQKCFRLKILAVINLKIHRDIDFNNSKSSIGPLPIFNLPHLAEVYFTESIETGFEKYIVSHEMMKVLLLAAPNIGWSKDVFLEILSKYTDCKLKEIVALHLFFKFDLTKGEQLILCNSIKSIWPRMLLGVKFKETEHLLLSSNNDVLSTIPKTEAITSLNIEMLMSLPIHVLNIVQQFASDSQISFQEFETMLNSLNTPCKNTAVEVQTNTFIYCLAYSNAMNIFGFVVAKLREHNRDKQIAVIESIVNDNVKKKEIFTATFLPSFHGYLKFNGSLPKIKDVRSNFNNAINSFTSSKKNIIDALFCVSQANGIYMKNTLS